MITQTRHKTLAENSVKLCGGCPKETIRQCSHCAEGRFCSIICEQKMPLSHLLKCNMRQVTSADYLYDDVLEDEIPSDPQVRQDYWFDRCLNKKEESHLLGVFAGLVHYHPYHITREELHRWRSNPGGNPYLVAKIVEKFEEISSNSRGRYFPWFLKHRARFELPNGHSSIPQAPCGKTLLQNQEAKARKHLAPEDQHKDVKDLTPLAKRYCFIFYSMIIDNRHPRPDNWNYSHWYDFGFVITNDMHEEGTLGSMYNRMLFGSTYREDYARSLGSNPVKLMNKEDAACSFDEFWKAWERGELMTIFDKCWPDSLGVRCREHDLLNRLRVFLEAEEPRPSIWRLRHFLAMEDVSVESAECEIAQAARDYGFSEELDTRTTMELKEFYVKLLKKADPLAVHRERMKGNLVRFAEGHVDIATSRLKEVLQGRPNGPGTCY